MSKTSVTETAAAETAATRELDRLTRKFNDAKDAVDDARTVMHDCIAKHLRARSAPPGKIANASPYDRNHIGRIGNEYDVTPLKGPNADPNEPAPEYETATVAAALAEVEKVTADFLKAVDKFERAQAALHKAITTHYENRTVAPGKIAEHVPYDRNHVLRLARKAGAAHVRPRDKASA
jgi:hypothetical protein